MPPPTIRTPSPWLVDAAEAVECPTARVKPLLDLLERSPPIARIEALTDPPRRMVGTTGAGGRRQRFPGEFMRARNPGRRTMCAT